MQMERRAGGGHVVLGHERDRRALLVRDLLRPVLVERGAIRHLERLRVAEVDLFLSAAPLALRGLDRYVRGLHAVADRADQRLLLRGLQDVVVLEVAGHRREVVVALSMRLLERLLETIELELGRGLDDVAEGRRALDLPLEDPAWRFLDRLPLFGEHVAEHERGLRQPRDDPRGREVRNHLHVPVAALPRRELEPGKRLHLHVDGEEVDTGVRAVVDDVIEEVPADDALAHEAAERIGEHGEDGVDVALLDELRESLAIEPSRHHADSSVPGWLVSRCRAAATKAKKRTYPDLLWNKNGGSISTSRIRQAIPIARRPHDSGERSSSGGLWCKPTRSEIRPAHMNQFREDPSARTMSPPGPRRVQRNAVTPRPTSASTVA